MNPPTTPPAALAPRAGPFPAPRSLHQESGLPRFDPAETGSTMISEWGVQTQSRQWAVLQAIERAWDERPWPDGLRSYHVFPSIDGTTLLHHSRWTEDAAFEAFVARHRDARVDLIDTEVPGIVRDGLGRFKLYRSHLAQPSPAPTGCFVVVRVEAATAALQQSWIDAVCAALEGDRVPGLIAAHFHVCDDGRIANIAQWESEAAHLQAMAGGTGIAQHESSAWHRVRTMPGITQRGLQRFRLPHVIGAASQASTRRTEVPHA
ncbi:hypothetical protein J2W49_004466 [Hydrogenophaga palleronii]|uniref:Antibiotic biosynthesis monooxygenase n=1 Tax=Hydrogenophaga palleronii TaxID=65655 RepID=A0ABU1WT63_9BURK|nr:antibiotic biosynthesis monooxygenase [Hydrogenophaga palleronii]MDR7152490.1 hypothetical protein [Hydrogenophaga palleronii]